MHCRYDIVYKQNVSAEDVYFGLDDDVTPSIASCNWMVIKVKLPDCTVDDIESDVNQTRLLVSTKEYYLKLFLPQKVNDKQAKAQFDNKTQTLSITLPLVKEDLF